jgi:arylsulfatase A-like enzyme
MLGDYRGIVGHILSVHDNLIHVPLIIRHPEYQMGLKVEGVVQTLDLYPSVLEWSGVPVSRIPSAQLQRPALSKAVMAANDPGGSAFAEEDYTDSYDVIEKLINVNPMMDPKKYPRQQTAIRSATHKYVWYNDRPGELYNLTVDRGEEHNLINADTATDRSVLRELQDALEAWRSKVEVFPPRVVEDAAEMDLVLMERLKTLGYVE